jgi:hypothetical protein
VLRISVTFGHHKHVPQIVEIVNVAALWAAEDLIQLCVYNLQKTLIIALLKIQIINLVTEIEIVHWVFVTRKQVCVQAGVFALEVQMPILQMPTHCTPHALIRAHLILVALMALAPQTLKQVKSNVLAPMDIQGIVVNTILRV